MRKTREPCAAVPAPELQASDTPAAPIEDVLRHLDDLYPAAECELHFENPFQLLIATILSAQCTDERVNQVTPALFARFPTPEAFVAASQEEVEALIRSTGFFRNKAKNIRAACQRIVEVYGSEVPRTMEELLTLPGVARKTANVVLGNAFGVAEGIAVDTHVGRLSRRLGLSRHEDPVKVERDLMTLLPSERWNLINHQLIWHGRRICYARKPDCPRCPMATFCPAAGRAPAEE